MGDIARKVSAHAVLDGGDFFHVKAPSRNSHAVVRRVVDVHRTSYPCPVYANVGNHDCVSGDIRNLPKQPLGVLFSTGVFNRLYDEHELVIGEGDVRVRVVGVPYHGTAYDLDRLSVRKRDGEFLVVCAHLYATPDGGSMFDGEDIVSYEYLKGLEADIFCFGHLHKDQGITELSPGKWVVNIGSMTRGSLTQDHMDRRPAVAVLEFGDRISIHRVDLNVSPSGDVFDVDGRVRQETREMAMEDFVAKVHASFSRTSVVSLEDRVREIADIPQAVREMALGYLERSR